MRHRPLRPCQSSLDPLRLAFQVRPCCRSLRRRGCCAVLHLAGELDVAAAPALLVAVGRTLDLVSPGRARRRGLVLDLGALTFCDAAGLTALVRTRRLTDTAGVPVHLAAPPRMTARMLAVCDLQRSFPLHPATTAC